MTVRIDRMDSAILSPIPANKSLIRAIAEVMPLKSIDAVTRCTVSDKDLSAEPTVSEIQFEVAFTKDETPEVPTVIELLMSEAASTIDGISISVLCSRSASIADVAQETVERALHESAISETRELAQDTAENAALELVISEIAELAIAAAESAAFELTISEIAEPTDEAAENAPLISNEEYSADETD